MRAIASLGSPAAEGASSTAATSGGTARAAGAPRLTLGAVSWQFFPPMRMDETGALFQQRELEREDVAELEHQSNRCSRPSRFEALRKTIVEEPRRRNEEVRARA